MRKLIVFKIEFPLIIYLIISFIFFTVIGTLSHEFGHYIVAEFFGVRSKIHFSYTSYDPDHDWDNVTVLQDFLMTFGGPVQTMLTGTVGLILLFRDRFDIQNSKKLKLKHWFFILISLFWLRQTANLIMWIIGYLLSNHLSQSMYEVILSQFLHLPKWSIITFTAVIGILVLFYIVFRYIPIDQRFTFVISGFLGGISGYYLWLESFGEKILP